MKKKFLALLFVATMLAGASMTVVAAGPTVSGNEENVTDSVSTSNPGSGTVTMVGAVQQTVINVTVTVNGNVVANPYGLVNSDIGLTAEETLRGAKITFTNQGDSNIEIGLTGSVKIEPREGDTLAANKVTVASSATDAKTSGTKKIYVQAQLQSGTSNKLFVTSSSTKKPITTVYDDKGVAFSVKPILIPEGSTVSNKITANSETAGVDSSVTVLITGATGKSQTAEWDEKDKFSVITTYDLKIALGTTATEFKKEGT